MLRLLAIFATIMAAQADQAPSFTVTMTVDNGKGEESFPIEVYENWSPTGAARFQELVESGFYDDSRFFRVIPGRVFRAGRWGRAGEWREGSFGRGSSSGGGEINILDTNSAGITSFSLTRVASFQFVSRMIPCPHF